MIVNFLIGGTQKGGTTALDGYLRFHPSVMMARQKEVHFFDQEALFCKSVVDYSLYHDYFESNHSGKILGEATPIYMYWPDAPKRIWEYNPAMKWILVLRNPIERAYSHWNMERNRGSESLPFLEALQRERERCRKALPELHRIYSYSDRGFYTEQIRRIWRFFPIEQTLILRSDELRKSTEKALNSICSFLGIDKIPKIVYKNEHVGNYSAAMSEIEHNYLRKIFEIEILSLEKMLNWDCSNWLAGKLCRFS